MQEENKIAIELVATKQSLTYCELKKLVDFSVEKNLKFLTVPQCYLKWVKNYTQKHLKLSTVIDYPNGNTFTLNKINAIKLALKNGADEIDIGVNHSELKSGNIAFVENELKQIRRALRGRLFKLYFNYNILNESEFIILCKLAQTSSVDYLTVDFDYDEQDFIEKYNLLKQRIGKKIKLKLLTNKTYENVKTIRASEIDGRICISEVKI